MNIFDALFYVYMFGIITLNQISLYKATFFFTVEYFDKYKEFHSQTYLNFIFSTYQWNIYHHIFFSWTFILLEHLC